MTSMQKPVVAEDETAATPWQDASLARTHCHSHLCILSRMLRQLNGPRPPVPPGRGDGGYWSGASTPMTSSSRSGGGRGDGDDDNDVAPGAGAAAALAMTPHPHPLHERLLRAHRTECDPMRVYHVVRVLGEGSMGSVAQVRRREAPRTEASDDGDDLSDDADRGPCRRRAQHKAGTWVNGGCCWGLIPLPCARRPQVRDVLEPVRSVSLWISSSLKAAAPDGGGRDSPANGKPARPPAPRTGSALVRYGRHRRPVSYALKSLHLDRCRSPAYQRELQNEVDLLRQLDHPHIVKALETFHYRNRLFLVLEYCKGGDLYYRDPYTEEEATRIMRAVLSAVTFLHSHQIVHRDLKYENIMFCDFSRRATVKLIDFGLSQKFARDEHLRDTVGTVYTMSPELLRGDYGAKTDVWSCGVIAFMLLSSSLPFYGENRAQVIRRIAAGEYAYASRRWQDIAAEAKVFVRDLLEPNPEQRPSAEESLRSAWLDLDEDALNESSRDMNAAMDNIQAHIQAYAEYSQLKKLALMVVAYQSTSEEIGFLRHMFRLYDKKNDGSINLDEFKATLADRYAYSDKEVEAMFKAIDIDGSGTIHYCEFLAATLEAHGSIDEERLAEAFDRLDADREGFITVQDLRDFLGAAVSRAYLDAVIDESDLTREHRVSYADFLGLWSAASDGRLRAARAAMELRRRDSAGTTASPRSRLASIGGGGDDGSEPSVAGVQDCDAGAAGFQTVKREASLRTPWV